MPLIRELKPGDTLRIGDIEIVAEAKSGKAARLRINTNLPIEHTRAGESARAESREPPRAPEAEPPRRPTLHRSFEPA